jgi:superfamily I DNA/RNA helicase
VTTAVSQRRVAYSWRSWSESVGRLGPNDVAQVEDAVEKYVRDPTTPGLNRERIQDTRVSLYSIRASKSVRILVHKVGALEVLLEAGQHDDVYERAKRMKPVRLGDRGGLRYVVLRSQPGSPKVDTTGYGAESDGGGPLLDHWSDEELAAAGVPTELLPQVRAVSAVADVEEFDIEVGVLLLDLMGTDFATWSRPVLDPEAEEEQALLAELEDFGILAGFSRFLDPQEARRLAAAPIEDWMVYLHPSQREVVLRAFTGPARVRGGPGTGKTAVALHRAAELARRLPESEGRILFTTFVKTLPPVFERLYHRIPGAPPGRVDFINVDSLANRFLNDHDRPMPLNPDESNSAFGSVVRRKGTPWERLLDAGFTKNYLKDEVLSVLKGRGVERSEQYLTGFQRHGRRTPMGREQREAVWALMEAWDAELAARGTVTFQDRVRAARDVARGLEQPHYRAVIVDEAQDISQIGMEFLHALVNSRGDRPRSDSLLVVGDGAQRVYPGGFRLLNAGVDVRGRTAVLRTNFRTTRQIMEAALAVAGGVEIDDLEEQYRRGEQDVESLRDGPRPSLRMFGSAEEELAHVAQRIMELVGEGRDLGDMLVAVATNPQVNLVTGYLKSGGVPVEKLSDYDGATTPRVKVGTYKRSKGLEFKAVLLPFLSHGIFPYGREANQSDEEWEEVRQMGLAELFVAMTRARDVLIVTAGEDVLPEIQRAETLFEWR